MAKAEASPITTHWEIIDHNCLPDQYVTYIVEIWDGAKNDPATEATRYITTFAHDSPALEDEEGNAVDPDFGVLAERFRGYRDPTGKGGDPLMWAELETSKEADDDARTFRHQSDRMAAGDGVYMYGAERTRVDLYNAFMDAVDRLTQDPEDKLAWEAVERWKTYNAEKHER